MAQVRIHKEMTIAAILGSNLDHTVALTETIQAAGLPCAGCDSAAHETLEMGLQAHGATNAQVDVLVERLNAVLAQPAAGAGEEGVSGFELTLAHAAVQRVQVLMQRKGAGSWSLRVAVIDGGCAGMSYDLSFRTDPAPTDDVFDLGVLKLFVDRGSQEFLHGTRIDYVDTLQESGFVYDNPNAGATCGCGSSFG
jgi:iron-sulfur cluster assembly accessory protein